MTTDGAPSMTDTVNGFFAICMRDDDFPPFLSYHCIIHQQALCCKILNMRHVMGICMKIVNSIRGRSLQRRMRKGFPPKSNLLCDKSNLRYLPYESIASERSNYTVNLNSTQKKKRTPHYLFRLSDQLIHSSCDITKWTIRPVIAVEDRQKKSSLL
ncbi:DUF4371 domain-containing protein [Trichonephila clavipes]|nr:DUF4371 domain-containing protein [Trichonephila clavipes]